MSTTLDREVAEEEAREAEAPGWKENRKYGITHPRDYDGVGEFWAAIRIHLDHVLPHGGPLDQGRVAELASWLREPKKVVEKALQEMLPDGACLGFRKARFHQGMIWFEGRDWEEVEKAQRGAQINASREKERAFDFQSRW